MASSTVPDASIVNLRRYPFDQDVWTQIRNPVWVLFRTFAVTQRYCAQSIFFALKFMLIERRDDYQLLQFVAEYKGLQLFAGIFTAVSGAGDYLRVSPCLRTGSHSTQMVCSHPRSVSDKPYKTDRPSVQSKVQG